MRRWLVERALPRRLLRVPHMFGQLGYHCFQLVDAAALLVDGLVQRLDQVFLLRQLDFDVDKTVFLNHGGSWFGKGAIMPATAVSPANPAA
jgi:hypothetical protein